MTDKKKGTLTPLWSFSNREEACIGILREHDNFIGSIVPYSKGRFISSSEDCQMIVWDFETKKPIKYLTEHREPINYMHRGSDEKYLVSASDDFTLKLWNTYNWEVIRTYKGHTDYVSKAVITITGLIVSVSKDQTVRVWDLKTGYCLHTLNGHNSWVYMLTVSPDGGER